jgi:hypothetical protein
MNVLISDDDRSHWDSLRRLLDQETEIQLSGTATEAETASRSVIARELRRILDGCPICDGGYRDHAYALLATVEMEKSAHGRARLREFYDLFQQYRWQEFLCLRDWNPGKDIVAGFAFRCTTGRVGIVTMLSPADADLPDNPLHYMILPVQEGKNLLTLLSPQKWLPLRSLPLQIPE